MKKQPEIQIRDAKNGYRVRSMGANGEPLQTSEVLETVAAVKKHVAAMRRTWKNHIDTTLNTVDCTKKRKFEGYAYTTGK